MNKNNTKSPNWQILAKNLAKIYHELNKDLEYTHIKNRKKRKKGKKIIKIEKRNESMS